MPRNEIFYVLICINNHVLSCLISMLSTVTLVDILCYMIFCGLKSYVQRLVSESKKIIVFPEDVFGEV